MKNIFYKLFSISLLGVCLMGCEDETKYLPLPQAVPFTMTVNNTTFVMGEKLVVDLDINPDKDGSEVLANEDFDIYFTAKTGTEDVSGVFKDFHAIDLAGPIVPTIIRVKPTDCNTLLIK